MGFSHFFGRGEDFVDRLETIVVRKHNPIRVHILIKATLQMRCLHAQQLEECIRLHVNRHIETTLAALHLLNNGRQERQEKASRTVTHVTCYASITAVKQGMCHKLWQLLKKIKLRKKLRLTRLLWTHIYELR